VCVCVCVCVGMLLDTLSLLLVVLASSIPVALVPMYTVSMALGSLELVSKGVIVTRYDRARLQAPGSGLTGSCAAALCRIVWAPLKTLRQ
jgi:hypothetical protein